MENYRGKAASPGIAIGRVTKLKKKEIIVKKIHAEDTQYEQCRFTHARQAVSAQWKDLYEKVKKEAGEQAASLFDAYRMILMDGEYVTFITDMIQTERVNAEYAVSMADAHFAEQFDSLEDCYIKERAADIKAISEYLLCALCGVSPTDLVMDTLQSPCIILADELTPAETVQLDREKVLAFVTRKGALYAHTVILARSMGIPAIVDVPISSDIKVQNGLTMGIADGTSGEFYLSPDEKTLQAFLTEQSKQEEQKHLLSQLKGKETITRSGKKIRLYANAGSVEELESALENDAEGIGLFRSEYLYLQSKEWPSEEEQFEVYRSIAERMEGKKIIIRTLDIGADKQVDYFELNQEKNPALGCRAIRICLAREEIFRTQLRALYRAGVFGNISIMIPMITSVWEVEKVKRIIKEVKADLIRQRLPYREAELGIMIETPAAVMISDLLAREVDFFSIGTNDLTQYTLAADRENPAMDVYYDTHHPAILRMIRMVTEYAHEHGIWVGICGESAADKRLTQTYLEMGIDELSVSPSQILSIRKQICEL